MNEASENLEFEKAIEYRELLGSVRQIAQKQKITHTDGEDKDIIAPWHRMTGMPWCRYFSSVTES